MCRDLKPENILLDERMQPVLADFGIAKAVRHFKGAAQQRVSGSTDVGTMGYQAPETCTSQPQHSKASDVYALGVVILQMITKM